MLFGSLRRPSLCPLFVCVSLAVLGSACSMGPEDSTIDIVFDACESIDLSVAEGTTDAETQAVTSGAALWNDRAFTKLAIGGEEEAPVLPIEFQKAALAFRGLYDDEHGILFVNEGIVDPKAMSITVAHEIGHAFGLTHVSRDTRSSVMNPGNVSVTPTDEDVAALAGLWGSCPR